MAKHKFDKLLKFHLKREERNGPWLAQKLGIHRGTVNLWENGLNRPGDVERVYDIITYLNITDRQEQMAFLREAGFAEHLLDPDQEHPASDPPPPPQDTVGSWWERLQKWVLTFLVWEAANEHMRSTLTGRFIYIFGVLTQKLTAHRSLTILLFVALLWSILRSVNPLFAWFVTGEGDFLPAALLYLLPLLSIPFVVASTVRADYQEQYEPATPRAQLILWWLKSTGAAVGFNLLSLTLWFVLLIAHYAGMSALSPLGLGMMWLFPLGMAYVAARRIPADRFHMLQEAHKAQVALGHPLPEYDLARQGLKHHAADITFFIASLLIGPFWLWFLWNFGGLLRDRTLGAFMLFSALLILAAWFALKKEKAAEN